MKFIEALDAVKNVIHTENVVFDDDFAIQVTLTNKDCQGTFYIEAKDKKLSVEPYDYVDNNLSIDILWGDLTKIIAKKMSVEKALESNKIKYYGDLEILKNFINKIPKPLTAEEKTSPKPKKTATKKKTK